MKQNEREINPGKEWAQRLKPGGCILVLVLTVLSVVLGMFPSLLTGLLSPILTALL